MIKTPRRDRVVKAAIVDAALTAKVQEPVLDAAVTAVMEMGLALVGNKLKVVTVAEVPPVTLLPEAMLTVGGMVTVRREVSTVAIPLRPVVSRAVTRRMVEGTLPYRKWWITMVVAARVDR